MRDTSVICYNLKCKFNQCAGGNAIAGQCNAGTIIIGRKKTESVKCYCNTNTKSQLKE